MTFHHTLNILQKLISYIKIWDILLIEAYIWIIECLHYGLCNGGIIVKQIMIWKYNLKLMDKNITYSFSVHPKWLSSPTCIFFYNNVYSMKKGERARTINILHPLTLQWHLIFLIFIWIYGLIDLYRLPSVSQLNMHIHRRSFNLHLIIYVGCICRFSKLKPASRY